MGVDVNCCRLVVVALLLLLPAVRDYRVFHIFLGVDPIMGTKMKGLLKGLHKISNIFDAKEEQEMQIGFPTDVKHVAHIGWDGPSAAVDNSPGWMNDFPSANSAPLPATANNGSGNEPTANVSPKWSSQDYGTANASSPKEASAAPTSSAKPSKRNTSSNAPSTDGEPSAVPKHSRRHQSGSDSPSRGESSEGSRRGRRERKTSAGSGGSDSSTTSTAAQDASGIPKQSRRKKVAKGSTSSEGSVRSSRSKAAALSADKGSEQLPVSSLKPMKEDTEGEQQ